jgi:small-conductance mechanosensitive channel
MTDWLKTHLPAWTHAWLAEVMLLLQVALILLVALSLRWLLLRLIARISARYDLPAEIGVIARRTVGFVIGFAALLLVLRVFGVSGGVLWGAFTGFATVAAVAFFAAWSVLTNLFCALLLLITRPFRLYDHIELLEASDKPGLRGRVVDMNLIFVTLAETHPAGGESLLRVPNSLFFQRATRRWRGEPVPQPALPTATEGGSTPVASGGSSVLSNFP